jgi:hypothetical protein
MYPAIPKGMAAKYKIPALNPLPASSPICAADLVQIEHCANDCNVVKNNKIKMNTDFMFNGSYFSKLA